MSAVGLLEEICRVADLDDWPDPNTEPVICEVRGHPGVFYVYRDGRAFVMDGKTLGGYLGVRR